MSPGKHSSGRAPLAVLFLCTGNSARSLLAEAILNRRGGERARAFSAGSHPKGEPHPLAIELLEARGYDTAPLRSKSWDEFAAPKARALDVVITVCDAAAGESCPVWPGRPANAHWGLPDPAAVEGAIAARRAAFREAYAALAERIERLLALPLETLTGEALERELAAIDEAARAKAAPGGAGDVPPE